MCQGPCHPGKHRYELVSNLGLWSQIMTVPWPRSEEEPLSAECLFHDAPKRAHRREQEVPGPVAEPRTGLSPGTLGATQLTGQLRACREGLGCGQ